ncbi:MAG TPA: GNAT family N-acetyltransferase [Stenomitos sp.]
MKTVPLLSGCVLQPAQAKDVWAIRALVLRAFLDPTQLQWSQFWVLVYEDRIIGCGQLRQFDDAQELGSLVIAPAWRDRGLGTFLVHHLIAQASFPLYLECLGERLYQYYQRLGFETADWSQLPPGMQRKFKQTRAIATVLKLPLHILHYRNQEP